MILIDADVLLIDCRYQRDPRHAINRAGINQMRQSGEEVGITTQALLEVVGVLSYGVSGSLIPSLPATLLTEYQLLLVPGPSAVPQYAGCTFDEVVYQLGQKMNLGDAVQCILIRRYAPPDSVLVTWNAKHFRGKVAVPVLTPQEWLTQHPPAGPTP